jgi:CHAT domain-containing protein
VLVRRAASREALESLAPGARFLHIATHGWFAPDSIASSADGARPEAVGFDEGARGSSPMVLTGLALAGGNLPADAHGHIPGLLTAQEIATLDLGACELAVLSA